MRNYPSLTMSDSNMIKVKEHKHLGLNIRSNLNWSSHVSSLIDNSSRLINILRSYQFQLKRSTLVTIYISFIIPILEYVNVIWDGCTPAEQFMLERIHLVAARVVTGGMRGTPNHQLYMETGWETLKVRTQKKSTVHV